MNFKHVTVAGGGVLGSQIAFQSAFKGFEVSVYDINEEALKMTDSRFKNYMEIYKQDVGATQEEVEAAYTRLSTYTDLAKAVENADIVIEAVPEVVAIKEDFYTRLGQVAPEKTIFCSNTSTFMPSQFAPISGRPEKFLTLHFATEVWKHNMGEVMGHPGTDKKYFEEVLAFAKAIGMVPIPIHKEQPGYVLNSMLVPYFVSALNLVVNEVASPEDVDKTWMIASGAPFGPFAWIDLVGLQTAYSITNGLGEQGDENCAKIAEYIKTNFIETGKLGKQAGEGFYKYPNPNYLNEDFLK
ncbi:3-hydroxyacyl-CoA dehydrogenase [Bacillus sp. Hm123]|uniref:3-hydroxyacyl-CoA dehydrogenase n=1 Tax=Bacillus sp. Hm123 TaxID=3450745 RepID=UPI003F43FE2A